MRADESQRSDHVIPDLVWHRLIARDLERRQVLTAVTARRGVVVVGPTGVGKTTLVAAVARVLDVARFEVTWTTATEAGREVPFGALSRLFGDLDRVDPALVHSRVAAELAGRAGSRTPVLVVDDAHCLDAPAAGVVLNLAGTGNVRLVLTVRADVPPPDAVVALWKDGYLGRLDVVPFDSRGTAELMRTLLRGDVSFPAVALLQHWTGGSPRLLTELVRHGRSVGHLVQQGGLWWWRGRLTVPADLADRLTARLDGLDAASLEAVTVAATGEPLPLTTLEALAPGAVEDLEEKRLLRTDGDGAEVMVRTESPILGAAIRHRLPPARRRRIATTLLAATSHPEASTGARWLLDAGPPVDGRLLLGACQATLFHDPELAAALGRRAVTESGGVAAAIGLADALVEAGAATEARLVLERARDAARSATGRLLPAIALAGHRCWVDRDPLGAHDELLALRFMAAHPAARDELDGVDAIVLLFSGRPAQALRLAERLLSRSRTSRGAVRAKLTRAVALTLIGRTSDAADAAESLLADLSDGTAGLPYAVGMGTAALALARLWSGSVDLVPMADPVLGRWPCGAEPGLVATPWSLFDGYARLIIGGPRGAVTRLREAVVQQAGGHRLFHSEASAWLALCLAQAGQPDEAERVLREHPPDRVAVVPGIASLAASAVAMARGDVASATAEIDAAISSAHAAGCWTVELDYLAYAADLPGPLTRPDLVERITVALGHVDAPRLTARGAAAVALVHRDGPELLEHATRLERVGLRRQAWILAESATNVLTARQDSRRATAVVLAARLRHSLGLSTQAAAQPTLTAREAEITRLAAGGLPDREIARRLVISVRTVESHLARAYHKLGVHSRDELPTTATPW
jgi:DNA-binding CsgD family transcriptional regulator